MYFIQIFFHYLLIFILKYFRSYIIFGIFCDKPGAMEVHVCNKFNHQLNKINVFFYFLFFSQILPNRVKIKYNVNSKIDTRSCVYTSIDNEA
jgi:hypothetical protein